MEAAKAAAAADKEAAVAAAAKEATDAATAAAAAERDAAVAAAVAATKAEGGAAPDGADGVGAEKVKELMGSVYVEIEALISEASGMDDDVRERVMDCVRKGIRKTTRRAITSS